VYQIRLPLPRQLDDNQAHPRNIPLTDIELHGEIASKTIWAFHDDAADAVAGYAVEHVLEAWSLRCPSRLWRAKGKRKIDAFGNMRTSSATNVGRDKDSETRQRAAIESFAKAAGYIIVDWFYDPALASSTERQLEWGLSGRAGRMRASQALMKTHRSCLGHR
jgi:hypothetical protein